MATQDEKEDMLANCGRPYVVVCVCINLGGDSEVCRIHVELLGSSRPRESLRGKPRRAMDEDVDFVPVLRHITL